MITGLAQHLWQSTIFAAAAALLAAWLRGHRAQVRHGIWLAASVKFLMPFSALVALGARIGLPAQSYSPGVVARGVEQVFDLNWIAAPSTVRSAGPGWLWLALLCGAGFSLRWALVQLRWRKIAAAVREAVNRPRRHSHRRLAHPARTWRIRNLAAGDRTAAGYYRTPDPCGVRSRNRPRTLPCAAA
jgi:hypothetical protein